MGREVPLTKKLGKLNVCVEKIRTSPPLMQGGKTKCGWRPALRWQSGKPSEAEAASAGRTGSSSVEGHTEREARKAAKSPLRLQLSTDQHMCAGITAVRGNGHGTERRE